MIEWTEQKVMDGMAPWMARFGRWLTLFVQPWYGDGIKWRGIIKHPDWTFTLKESFTDKEEATQVVEDWAERLKKMEEE